RRSRPMGGDPMSPQRKKSASADRPSGGANHCRALIRIDGAAARRKIKAEYERALRDLERARKQVERFQSEDVPGFARWINSTFGWLLTELRETDRKRAELLALLFELEQEAFVSGAGLGRAYARVMARRAGPTVEDAAAASARPGNADAGTASDAAAEEFTAEEEREPDEVFEDLFGTPPPPHRPRPEQGHRPAKAVSRLKELYRALARLLHPDARKEITARQREWWHQVQAAYAAGDVEQLEVILTLCEIDEKGTTDHTSCSLLQRITKQLRASCRALRRQLAGFKKDPAWGFAARTTFYSLEVQVRRMLECDLAQLREERRQLEAQVELYRRASERMARRRATARKRAWRSSAEG
ncbi:MAG TPA: hypothetical protein VNO52_12845, partial [Methylomirabilota bacterium]|nr:hypothetical protein [Methylomirabilota bacterium]